MAFTERTASTNVTVRMTVCAIPWMEVANAWMASMDRHAQKVAIKCECSWDCQTAFAYTKFARPVDLGKNAWLCANARMGRSAVQLMEDVNAWRVFTESTASRSVREELMDCAVPRCVSAITSTHQFFIVSTTPMARRDHLRVC